MAQPNRLTICCSHADPGERPRGEAFASGSPTMHAAWVRARAIVAEFVPELVVFFGTDHRRAFRDVIPTLAVALGASARGDRSGPVGDYRVPAELARELGEGLVARDVDVALAYRPNLDHAFGLTARDLLGGVGTYPVIPIFVNCASPPIPSFTRVAAIGRAIGEVLDPRPERILFVGSGGLTHDLPGFYPDDDGVDWSEPDRLERNARLNRELAVPGRRFGPDWDSELLAGLASDGESWVARVGRDVIRRGGNGAQEVLTWIGAWAAGGEPLSTLGYEFNEERSSSQALAVSSSVLSSPMHVVS